MKKLILIFASVLIFGAAHIFSEETIRISLRNGDIERLLFFTEIPTGKAVSVPVDKELRAAVLSLDKKISKAKRISVERVEKACIDDGEYIVEYPTTGKKYEIQNEYWVYETQSGTFYRCNILNELRKIRDMR